MPEPPFDLSQAHRWFAIEFNNRTWDLVEASTRSPAEIEELIHGAHEVCPTGNLHSISSTLVVNQPGPPLRRADT